MTYHYCTLFDSFFLSRGLALYDSLKRTTPDFRLYVFPFDEKSDSVMRELNLPDVVVVSQPDFESPRLQKIKSERSRGEYCWTCTPVILEYCLDKFNIPHCTYVDADLWFFANANSLVDEMGEASVQLTAHRYTPRYDQSKTCGRYCVQFLTFRNDERGRKALAWWKEKCLDWCFDRIEEGRFGDQKYLDDWLTRFEGIHELQNEGGGLAPWNIQQYEIKKRPSGLVAVNRTTSREWQVVFYHFHAIKFLTGKKLDLGAYQLTKPLIDMLYRAYLAAVKSWNKRLLAEFTVPLPELPYRPKKGTPAALHKLVRRLAGVYYVYDRDQFAAHGTHP